MSPIPARWKATRSYQHGTLRGLPHVLIEMRQDLIATDAAAQAFAVRLKPILDAALSDMARAR